MRVGSALVVVAALAMVEAAAAAPTPADSGAPALRAPAQVTPPVPPAPADSARPREVLEAPAGAPLGNGGDTGKCRLGYSEEDLRRQRLLFPSPVQAWEEAGGAALATAGAGWLGLLAGVELYKLTHKHPDVGDYGLLDIYAARRSDRLRRYAGISQSLAMGFGGALGAYGVGQFLDNDAGYLTNALVTTLASGAAVGAEAWMVQNLSFGHRWLPYLPLLTLPPAASTLWFNVSRRHRERVKAREHDASHPIGWQAPALRLGPAPGPDGTLGLRLGLDALSYRF